MMMQDQIRQLELWMRTKEGEHFHRLMFDTEGG